MITTPPPAMLDGERSDAYTRRTGYWPPRWTEARRARQEHLIRDWKEITLRGIDAADRAAARRNLRRWGVDA